MKKYYFGFLLFFSLLSFSNVKSQTIKGLYVDDFDNILGNSFKEDSLLDYVQANGFNYLTLYDLMPVHVMYNLTNASSCVVLSDFIQRAKQNFGVLQIGAAGENFSFFKDAIDVYNQQHSDTLQKIDVYNVEFEFWNTVSVGPGDYYCTTYLQSGGYTCDTAGAFNFYKKLISQVDSLAKISGVISETYVGWFNQGQANVIGNTMDRILLHDYISNYNSLYNYVKQRLQFLAGRNILTDVIPIFSSEPSFLGPWLSTHDVYTPFNDLQTYLANETGNWKQYIKLMGYQWFTYTLMPYNAVSTGELNHQQDGRLFPFPNPAVNELWVDESTDVVEISNLLGENLYRFQSVTSRINISHVPAGIYFCTMRSGESRITKKLIVLK